MGRRKERRLAAKIATGRKVKLDIFAEPASGDLGGSFAHEAGEEKDSNVDSGLPKSPSSSGGQPPNPLFLLGQYSDDDLDEGTSDQSNNVALTDHHGEAKEAIGKESEKEASEDALSSQKVDEQPPTEDSAALGSLKEDEGNKAAESNVVSADAGNQEFNPDMKSSATLDPQAAKDADYCWNMVLHEESNRYYYWNTVTGETSWEIPEALVGKNQIQAGGDNAESAQMPDSAFITQANGGGNENATQVDLSSQESKGNAHLMGFSTGAGDTGVLENYSSYPQQAYSIAGDWSSMTAGSAGYVDGAFVNVHDAAVNDLPSYLLNLAETLLGKFASIGMSEEDSNRSLQHGHMPEYMLEIKTRLSDLKALFPYGSSLLPFWMHSERELKKLEYAVDNELRSYLGSAEINKQSNALSFEGQGPMKDHGGSDAELEPELRKTATTSDASPGAIVSLDIQNSSHDDSTIAKQTLGNEKSTQSGWQESNGNAEATADVEDSSDDVDMDVDMEVEDTSVSKITDTSVAEVTPSVEILPNPTGVNQPTVPDEESMAPAPPDEEWIPPPPPDDEEIPPPPPDDPPEAVPAAPVPSSCPDPIQPVLYAQGYSFTYPGSQYGYYADATTGTGGGFYAHVDGTQNLVHNPTMYYEPVPNIHPEAPAVVSDPVGSAVYYGIQDGGSPSLPVVSAQSSSLQAAAGPVAYDEALQHTTNGENSFLESQTEVTVSENSCQSHVVSAPASISVKESGPVAYSSSTSTSMVSGTAAVAKPPSKVSRVKKRTVAAAPSLRSNKRVSSLVDKWKAAKEELEEEEEEEPENPLEILEKKRRREIEEWRAQQIASGEAKDNANFQPVVGDWRDRVKRRRAQKGVTVEAPNVAAEEVKPPNPAKVSGDLPPGWQAYWDESTKQVYYANVLTSDTTWTKPTQ